MRTTPLKRFRRFRLPNGCHPLIIQLYHEMLLQRISPSDVEKRAGLGSKTIENWRNHQLPNVINLQSAFNVLGFELCVKKITMNNSPLKNAQKFASLMREVWPDCMQHMSLHQMPETVALSIRTRRKSINILFTKKGGYSYSCLGDKETIRYHEIKTIDSMEHGIDERIFEYLNIRPIKKKETNSGNSSEQKSFETRTDKHEKTA